MSRPISGMHRAIVATLFGCGLAAGAVALRPSAAPAAAGDEKVRAKFEVYKDRGGEYRWRLRATNTQVLAMSADGYKEKRDCLHAIESVKRDAANAPVEEQAEGQQPQRKTGPAEGQGDGTTNAQRKTNAK